jgi:hypothetical protein
MGIPLRPFRNFAATLCGVAILATSPGPGLAQDWLTTEVRNNFDSFKDYGAQIRALVHKRKCVRGIRRTINDDVATMLKAIIGRGEIATDELCKRGGFIEGANPKTESCQPLYGERVYQVRVQGGARLNPR